MTTTLCKIVATISILAAMPAALAQQQQQQVGPEYKVLKKDVGRWTATVKLWTGPGEPTESPGVEVNRMVGPYFLVSDFKSEMDGQPFHGHGVFGYDRQSKKYSGVWVDSMTPVAMHMFGEYDKEKDTLVYVGESVDPSGEKLKFKNVMVYNEDGTRTLTMYMNPADSDEWTKAMEIHYVKQPRAKKQGGKPKTAEVVD